MGVFRAGVRVTRALTPTPSSSSGDEDEPRPKKQCNLRRASAISSDDMAPRPSQVDEEGEELFQVEDSVCALPDDLFTLPDLTGILSLETWNECLTEEEREFLCSYLPDMKEDAFRNTLKEVFSGKTFNFSSPIKDLFENLKEGMCIPHIASARQALLTLQRKQHYHDLRRYHNGMVNVLLEMKNLWLSNPNGSLEERLYSWRTLKSSAISSAVVKHLSGGRGMLKYSKAKFVEQSSDLTPATLFHGNADRYVSRRTQDSFMDPEFTEEGLEENEFQRVEKSAFPVATAEVHMKKKKRTGSSRRDHKMKHELQSQVKPLPRVKIQKAQNKSKQWKMNHGHGNFMCSDFQPTTFQGYDREPIFREVDGHSIVSKSQSRTCEMEEYSPGTRQNFSPDKQAKLQKESDLFVMPPSATLFSFSILRFMSAVRTALVNTLNTGINDSDASPPGISFSEVVARVHATPGDHSVFQIQMPLDCLVRGTLKILSGNVRKPALKGVDPFVVYDKVSRCWSWIGPLPLPFIESNMQSLAESWSISPSTLYELQDLFAKWLKASENTLKQLWELSLLPMPEFPVIPDVKDRFKDLKTQKSHSTIMPSTHELRSLFHREETIRYSTSEIAFCYTTADGRKSAVAPLRRITGKSKAKARDHFMLKPDRPSHITILCLVRDAAARLPQCIGTRSDVCILIRDSQFIVEDVPEVQLGQIVSGALDRLHHEKDPCVRYDVDKKLWLYLHADRNEEDFEEGGTASTRSSRRSKKEGLDVACSAVQEHRDNEGMSEAAPESGSYNCSSGAGGGSASPESLDSHQKDKPVTEQARDEVLMPFIDIPPSMQPFCGNMQSHPMGWEMYKAGKELSITQ